MSNAPTTMNLTGSFISTKTPTSNAHVVTKLYADSLRPPAITNGVSNSVEIDNTGIVTMNASGHSSYS